LIKVSSRKFRGNAIPVCALTGQVAISLFGKGAFQESGDEGINITAIFNNFTKKSTLLQSEQNALHMVQNAVRLALTSPTGPVHLSLPVDVMKRAVDKPDRITPKFSGRYFDQEKVQSAALALLLAKKPAIIAGWGAVLGRAANELLELAELLDIPVATSPKAKGIFPESHPLSLGVLGFAGSEVARDYLFKENIDVLLAVGTSFNEFMTSGWDERLLPAKHLIHIDVNPEKIGKNYFTSLGMLGHAKTVLNEICKVVKSDDHDDLKETLLLEYKSNNPENSPEEKSIILGGLYKPQDFINDIIKTVSIESKKSMEDTIKIVGDVRSAFRSKSLFSNNAKKIFSEINKSLTLLPDLSNNNSILKRIKGQSGHSIEYYKKKYAKEKPVDSDKPYDPRHLICDIQNSFSAISDDTIYFAEIGNVMAWSIHYLNIDKPYSFFVSLGYGGMGYATAAAVGGKLGAGDSPVVSLVGDGSFLMSGFEVATAVNYDIPVIWIVFNNAMHGMIYHGRRMFEQPVPEGIPSPFKKVNFAKVAEGLGAVGIEIKKSGGLTPSLIREVVASKRPTVLDVRIDESKVPPIGTRIETVIKHFTN